MDVLCWITENIKMLHKAYMTISESAPVGKYGQDGTAYKLVDRYLCVVISSNGFLVDAYDITSQAKKIKFF